MQKCLCPGKQFKLSPTGLKTPVKPSEEKEGKRQRSAGDERRKLYDVLQTDFYLQAVNMHGKLLGTEAGVRN